MKIKLESSKMIALIIIVLMIGSSIGLQIYYSLKPQENENQIPSEKILDYQLTDVQQKFLLSNGFTLIEFYSSPDCVDCEKTKRKLEDLTRDSDNQIYLQKLFEARTLPKIKITSLRGQEILINATNEEIKNDICDLILRRPLWCIKI